ncbi:hypothetical protein LGM46_00715 [Burkholderia arboris]|uniref:hypothetical protein n=1 Tax=Burkholderia arboris TaxID=488730 RepID=UPI001CF4B6B5|nr:hypothetical protein [Burkholderia arboris]MCA8031491.1 hypothetical protein [Burkholderia arboris]
MFASVSSSTSVPSRACSNLESIVTYKLQKRWLERGGPYRDGAAADTHAASSWLEVSGSDAGFTDEDHSFIRFEAWRFGRIATVDGVIRGAYRSAALRAGERR